MTTTVRFILSHDTLKWDFIAFKMNIISLRKCIADINVVNDVMDTCKSVITRGQTSFMTRLDPLNNTHMINKNSMECSILLVCAAKPEKST